MVEGLSMGQLFMTGPSLITPNWKSSSVNIKQYTIRMHKTIHLKSSFYLFMTFYPTTLVLILIFVNIKI